MKTAYLIAQAPLNKLPDDVASTAARENASTPYPLVPPAKFSALTLVPPNPRVLKTGTKTGTNNRY
jgi:hypothetical protein